jgi:hypothetical protein
MNKKWMEKTGKWLPNVLGIALPLCFVFAVSQTEAVKTQVLGSYVINLTNNLEYLLYFGFSYALLNYYVKQKDQRLRKVSMFAGILLSICYVVGLYCHYENNLFVDAWRLLVLLLQIIGIAIVTVPLSAFILTAIETLQNHLLVQNEQIEKEKHPALVFLFYWIIMMLCYLPVFLHIWPVNFIYDAKYQMVEVITNTYKIHHPIIHTYLMGLAYTFGQSIGNVSQGMQFYTILQMLILTGAFSYTLTFLYRVKAPKILRRVVFCFYALFPLNPMFAVTATKDVLFGAFFLIFVVLLVDNLRKKELFTLPQTFAFLVIGSLMLIFRKNSLYAFYVAIPFLILAVKGWQRKMQMGLLILGTLLCFQLTNLFFIDLTAAVDNGSRREALSVPLQQLARVASYHRDEMPDELYEEFILYVQESDIAFYNPYNSDAIKNNANEQLLRSNFGNFLKLWLKVGLQFPDEYLESFLTNTMGYWYLGDTFYQIGDGISSYHTLIGMGDEVIKEDLCKPVGVVYNYLFYDMKYREIPLFSLLFNPALYFWLLVFYFCAAIYQKQYCKMIPMIYVLAYILTCLLGPLVALRYVYGVVVTTPVIVYLMSCRKL